jgi:Fe-S cluster assembly iron-binding protein IscA
VSEPDISLSENAARRVAAIAARKQAPPILRLAVHRGGCAGFTYSFEIDHAPDD